MKRSACEEKRVSKEDGAGMGKKMVQVRLACCPAFAHLNTGDVVVGSPRFPTTLLPPSSGLLLPWPFRLHVAVYR